MLSRLTAVADAENAASKAVGLQDKRHLVRLFIIRPEDLVSKYNIKVRTVGRPVLIVTERNRLAIIAMICCPRETRLVLLH